ncbi:FeoB-associated Cys-rich membrane protein [Larkinella humicola]|uniref:FeoB-associated Cys-rich membrane protein n=1 Tax=Larkinella humicola TaxID=2607654 RepID=A0A5N1JT60_9BACT|nr:FeoB-associated Cys-rich membrane protein [Larkinella humicola]KAA9357522.1 FeoB-associated Cys-rich membrane protein [Larkinella humicola]
MFEHLLIGLIFLSAVAYLGRRAWKSLFRKEAGCGKGCGCSADAKVTSVNKSGRLPVN